MIDILFCAIPYSNLDHIYSAPAILKGVVIENGYTAKTVEFGHELFKLCNNDVDLFTSVQQYFISNKNEDKVVLDIVERFYNNTISYFKNNPSRYIGISVFSVWTHKTAWELLTRIKQENISSKIIIGGTGANVGPYRMFNDLFQLRGLEKTLKYGKLLEKRNLADYVVLGDGEDAILSILQHNSSLDTNVIDTQHRSEFFRSPIPDYSDYDFSFYRFADGEIRWPITGSKGCVRDCDFCDIAKQFGKYRYRGGKDIANEMIEIANTKGARKFNFSDSLVNGGLKPFKEFLEIVGDYNDSNPSKSITWSGQYICRPDVPDEIYDLIKRSGGEGLTIGAESGSNAVLAAMNKKTTVEALYAELEKFSKRKITCVLLLMVGHWSETWNDFVDHCRMIVNIAPYVRSGCVSGVRAGLPMIMHDQTPAWENKEQNQIIISDFDPNNIWYCGTNPSNTYKERIFRKLLVVDLCKKMRIPLLGETEDYLQCSAVMGSNKEKIVEFYQQFGIDFDAPTDAEEHLANFEQFVNKLTHKNSLELDLTVVASECNGMPNLQILKDGNLIYNKLLNNGTHVIKLQLPQCDTNNLSFKMNNKDAATDTKVINGNVVEDKFIEIKSLKIDNYDLCADPDFFRSQIEYVDDLAGKVDVKFGFWNNSTMSLSYPKEFQLWYQQQSSKNSSLESESAYREFLNTASTSTREKLVKLVTSK